ncbi:hypothetical protein I215_14069 [Galbibacter marinus]|uniref:Uncharacterized protein n=1 Tax=Galbibacter marinus TaxID=555500 RepID=K2NZ85_9FLAO|nr:hypothetical protein I215_14069 [Galbibacter marinus]
MLLSLSYLNYLWTSSNQHGVHSPFVYQLLTKALYRKNNIPIYDLLLSWKDKYHIKDSRKIKILNRSLSYLNNDSFKSVHTGCFTQDRTQYVNILEHSIEEIEQKLTKAPFIIVDNIDKENQKWKHLCQRTTITLSVNFYNIGFLFYKPGQHKENFKIRI